MADKKSRQYSVDGNSYAFEFVSDKLAGIKKSVNGLLNPIPPKGSEFASVSSSDEAINAFNVAKFGPNKAAYVDTVEKLSEEELQDYYDKEVKKGVNEQFIENFAEPALAFTEPRDTGGQYNRGNSSYRSKYRGILGNRGNVYAYPLDIDLDQDHFKITKYRYVRPTINQSKSARVKSVNDVYTNVAGDSVIGSEIDGSVILPMPKATDANAAQWGGSDLTVTDLAALGTAKGLDEFSPARFFGRTSSGLKDDVRRENNEIRKQRAADGQSESFAGNILAGGQATAAQSISKLTGLLGANFDTDTFLARTGGRVLNPNAEMLFQGPVIRDFSFEFQMIARSKKEGEEIREIIRFFKLGMAPKFQNIAFLANPDVFKLEYRNSDGPLKTVNRFNPGGLALTALKTDYAPNGYWAAYTDSQPVALKLAMSFTELRPIYHGDQAKEELDGTVGY
jgi:hypothetical protein